MGGERSKAVASSAQWITDDDVNMCSSLGGKSSQVLKHVKMNKTPCFVIIRAAESELLHFHLTPSTFEPKWQWLPLISKPNVPPREAKMWRLSVETSRSRLVHGLWPARAPVCLWSARSAGHTDEQEPARIAPFEDLNHLLLIRLLWRCSVPPRLKSNVTESARVLLPLKVMRCVSKADYDMGRLMAATPTQLLRPFHFSSKKKLHQTNYASVCRRNLATLSDTWHILASECLHSPGGGRRGHFFSMLNIQCWLQAGPEAAGATFMCSTNLPKHLF